MASIKLDYNTHATKMKIYMRLLGFNVVSYLFIGIVWLTSTGSTIIACNLVISFYKKVKEKRSCENVCDAKLKPNQAQIENPEVCFAMVKVSWTTKLTCCY